MAASGRAAAKCTPLRCRNCRHRVRRPEALGGKPPSGRKYSEATGNSASIPEGKRGKSSVLGRDRMWQGTRWNTRRRVRPVRHRDGTGGESPPIAVPGVSGCRERQRGLPAESGSSVGGWCPVRRTRSFATVWPHLRGTERPPFPSFLSRAKNGPGGISVPAERASER